MKNYLFITILLCLPLGTPAQLIDLSTRYLYNGHVINPAFVGCQDALSANLLYRNQWVGFEGAPKNQLFNIHAPLKNEKIGLGLVVDHQGIGIFNKTTVSGNYAYRTELGRGMLALGIGLGISHYRNGWDQLAATHPDDEKLQNNPMTAFAPAISIGTYYYNDRFFLGFSIPFFLSEEPAISPGTFRINSDPASWNYFLNAGYNFELGRDFSILPSILLRYRPDDGLQPDVLLTGNLRNRVWLGAGYRSEGIILGNLYLQLNYQLRLGYSYEVQVGNPGHYMNGTHEIQLNYVFRYSRNVSGPRKF